MKMKKTTKQQEARLSLIAERLKDRVIYCKHHEAVKKMYQNAKFINS